MTATALAFDPALDPAFDLLDDGDGFDRFPPARPELRLIQGGGYGSVLPAIAASTPSASVEMYRRRRFFALVALTTLVLALAWIAGVSITSFSSASAGTADPSAQVSSVNAAQNGAPVVHVVVPGDTYAAIAADLGAANAVAAGEQLRMANGGAELVIGQRIVVDPATLSAAG